MVRTALELARQAGEFLGEHGIENARLEAELLLSGVLGLRRPDLYLQFDRPVGEEEIERFRDAVRRRLRHEPLQYILGEADFRKLRLRVDRRVLIPRPETEVLVGQVLQRLSGRTGLRALDIGTGSGAIALSLAREGGFDQIVATDASAGALDVARSNAERCGVAARIEFRLGDVWEAVGEDADFDVIVSNPPYVADAERDSLQPEVREWEPHSALFAGPDGLAVLSTIVDGALARLRTGGLLALEIGADQGEAMLERVRDRGYGDPRIVQDLAGRPRIVLANRVPSETPRPFMEENQGDR